MINQFAGEYRFLSNFWPAEIQYLGRRFATVEHAYQWAKEPTEERYTAISSMTAAGAKAFGRKCNLRPDWIRVRDAIMLELVRAKFKIPDLQRKLLATNDVQIVEGNYWHDVYWGVCSCKRCGNQGANKLGLILMQVRAEYR